MSLIESQQNIAIASQEEVIASQVEQVEVPQSNMSANETTEEQQQAASETASSPEAAEDVESFASSSSDSDSESEAEEEPESKTCRNLTIGLGALVVVGALAGYGIYRCIDKKNENETQDETNLNQEGTKRKQELEDSDLKEQNDLTDEFSERRSAVAEEESLLSKKMKVVGKNTSELVEKHMNFKERNQKLNEEMRQERAHEVFKEHVFARFEEKNKTNYANFLEFLKTDDRSRELYNDLSEGNKWGTTYKLAELPKVAKKRDDSASDSDKWRLWFAKSVLKALTATEEGAPLIVNKVLSNHHHHKNEIKGKGKRSQVKKSVISDDQA